MVIEAAMMRLKESGKRALRSNVSDRKANNSAERV